MTSFCYFNIIALACILTALAPINGPLLQRASSVAVTNITFIVPINVPITSSLIVPSVNLTSHMFSVSLFMNQFSSIVLNYLKEGNVNINSTGCSSVTTCAAIIRDAEFTLNCSSYRVLFFFIPQAQQNGSYNG